MAKKPTRKSPAPTAKKASATKTRTGRATSKEATDATDNERVEDSLPNERREKSDRRQDDRRTEEVAVGTDRRDSDRRKVQRRRQIDPTTCERDYSNDEVEFMHAIDHFKRTTGESFPTCQDVLDVIKDLGYQKVESV